MQAIQPISQQVDYNQASLQGQQGPNGQQQTKQKDDSDDEFIKGKLNIFWTGEMIKISLPHYIADNQFFDRTTFDLKYKLCMVLSCACFGLRYSPYSYS